MNKKYTKKQICEAIAYWENVLESSNKANTSKSINELVKMASHIVPAEANLVKKALNETELNEGTTSGLAMGIMGTLLALSMMGKISLNMKDALSQMDSREARVCQMSLEEIGEELNKINDNVNALCSKENIDDPTVEQLVAATERAELFKKIMAEP